MLFKERFIAVASGIDKFKEPLEELVHLHASLKEAFDSGDANDKENFRCFMDEDLIPGLAKRLTKKSPIDERVRYSSELRRNISN